MEWIYFSPHYDDVAFSCGGLVWEQANAGDQVSIQTVCAGSPPVGGLSSFAHGLHKRWKSSQKERVSRRAEDKRSCTRLRAGSRYFSIPDCIYRRDRQAVQFMYTSEAALNGPLHPGDHQTVEELRQEITPFIQVDMNLVCPLALGNHIDHQLTRLALEALDHPLWYYADYPYVEHHRGQVETMEQAGWVSQIFPISSNGLTAWQDSIAAHRSQISTFWSSEAEMRQAIEAYLRWDNGIRL
ncbi:MAG: PIG-L deacetylase family protein, partial [Acidobacteriaceae bacterium]